MGLGVLAACSTFAGCAGPGSSPFSKVTQFFHRTPQSEAERARESAFDHSRELGNGGRLHLKYAQWREDVGDLAEARESYGFALDENPESIDALIGLARVDQLSGRVDDAEAGYQAALKLRPDSAQAQHALGQFYSAQSRWQDALPLLQAAAQTEPDTKQYQQDLGIALVQNGHKDVAVLTFQRALSPAEAHYNVAYLLNENGQQTDAIEHLHQALKIDADLPPAQRLLAELTGGSLHESPRQMQRRLAANSAMAGATLAPARVQDIRQTGEQVIAGGRRPSVTTAAYSETATAPMPQIVPGRPSQQRPMPQPAVNPQPQGFTAGVSADNQNPAPPQQYQSMPQPNQFNQPVNNTFHATTSTNRGNGFGQPGVTEPPQYQWPAQSQPAAPAPRTFTTPQFAQPTTTVGVQEPPPYRP